MLCYINGLHVIKSYCDSKQRECLILSSFPTKTFTCLGMYVLVEFMKCRADVGDVVGFFVARVAVVAAFACVVELVLALAGIAC